MYIPDRVFVRRLTDYDRALSVAWIPQRQRWGIYRQTMMGKVLVYVVRNADGSYRSLDSRTLEHLRKIDTHVRGRRIAEEAMAEQEAFQAARRRQEKEDMRAIVEQDASMVHDTMMADMTPNIPKEDKRALLEQHLGGKEKLEEALS